MDCGNLTASATKLEGFLFIQGFDLLKGLPVDGLVGAARGNCPAGPREGFIQSPAPGQDVGQVVGRVTTLGIKRHGPSQGCRHAIGDSTGSAGRGRALPN